MLKVQSVKSATGSERLGTLLQPVLAESVTKSFHANNILICKFKINIFDFAFRYWKCCSWIV